MCVCVSQTHIFDSHFSPHCYMLISCDCLVVAGFDKVLSLQRHFQCRQHMEQGALARRNPVEECVLVCHSLDSCLGTAVPFPGLQELHLLFRPHRLGKALLCCFPEGVLRQWRWWILWAGTGRTGAGENMERILCKELCDTGCWCL